MSYIDVLRAEALDEMSREDQTMLCRECATEWVLPVTTNPQEGIGCPNCGSVDTLPYVAWLENIAGA